MNKLLLLFTLLVSCDALSMETLKPYTGDELPAFELTDLDGETHRLADYRGKVLLVNFWATWCAPCIREMPSMQRLKVHLQGKPFALLAINMGEREEALMPFLQGIGVDLDILLDVNGSVGRNWGVFAYPSSFLLDNEGQVTHVRYGEAEWDDPGIVSLIESMFL